METQEALETLGLNDKQAKIYLSLLERGPSSAYALAVHSGLKRSTAYVVLDELVRKGFATRIPRSKKQLYRPIPPEKVFDEYRMRFKKAKTTLPKLKAMQKNIDTTRPQALLYEGIDGVNEVYNYKIEEMENSTITGFYATPSKRVAGMIGKELLADFYERRNKLGIKLKGVTPDDPKRLKAIQQKMKENYLHENEIRSLSLDIYSSNVSIETGKSWVKIVDFENLQALVIENPAFAKTMREIFEIVWEATEGK